MPKDLSPEKIVRNFIGPDGRLKQIPTKEHKLSVVLAYLAGQFEPGRRYPEAEVNEVLTRFHDDYCSLRRFLIVHHLMARANGVYWVTPAAEC